MIRGTLLVRLFVVLVLVDISESYLGLRRRRSSCEAARGGWSEWSQYTACTCTAAMATKTRYRYCINPEPSCGGRVCYGATSFTTACLDLAVAGGWSGWSAWAGCEPCSTSQYGTIQTRGRTCADPAPSCGGQQCEGHTTESSPCDIDGVWESWSPWGRCRCDHVTGMGARSRGRSCAAPQCQGRECEGAAAEKGACDEQCCMTIDGGWSSWLKWDSCQCNYKTGRGTRTRSRRCADPAPFCGGVSCEGEGTEEGSCDEQCCKRVEGVWSSWADWSRECRCDHLTGEGVYERMRECTAPAPSCGGRECEGAAQQKNVCDELCCKLTEGGWGGWSAWNTVCLCDHSSGTGSRNQTRRCDSPEPQCGGRSCTGDSTNLEDCSAECCQTVPGGWSEWGPGGACNCDHSTGTGVLLELRTCDAPPPACHASGCEGDTTRYTACNDMCCLTVAGEWSAYSEWSECSCDHSTGTGTRTRARLCNNPAPSCFGRSCAGPERAPGTCDAACCVTVHGSWGDWGAWSRCHCVGLQKSRSRECSGAECGGSECEGHGVDVLPCSEDEVCACTFGEQECSLTEWDKQANTHTDRCDTGEIQLSERCISWFVFVGAGVVAVVAIIPGIVCYIKRCRRLNIPYKVDGDLHNTLESADAVGPVHRGALSLRTEGAVREGRWDSEEAQCEGTQPNILPESPDHDNWYMGDPLQKLRTVPQDSPSSTVIRNPTYLDPSVPDPSVPDPSVLDPSVLDPSYNPFRAPAPPAVPGQPLPPVSLSQVVYDEITIGAGGAVQYHTSLSGEAPSVTLTRCHATTTTRPSSDYYETLEDPRLPPEHPYQDLDRGRAGHPYAEGRLGQLETARDRLVPDHPYHDIQSVLKDTVRGGIRSTSSLSGYVEMNNEEEGAAMNNEGAAGYVRSSSTGYVKMTSETLPDNVPGGDYVNNEHAPDSSYVLADSPSGPPSDPPSGYVAMDPPREGFVEEGEELAEEGYEEEEEHIYFKPGAL